MSSSGSAISAPPSPSAATVSRSGRASAAPIALPRPSPTHWNACGKTNPAASGTRQVHRGPAHEVARVDHDGPLGGQQVVERDRERPRVEAAGRLRVGLVAPAPLGQRRGQRGTAPARTLGHGLEQRLGGRGRVADHARRDRPVGADRVAVEVDLGDPRRRADQRAVARRPLVERRAEADDDVGVREQLGGERRREPARDPGVVRVAGEQPVRDRRRGEHRPAALPERAERRPGARPAPRRGPRSAPAARTPPAARRPRRRRPRRGAAGPAPARPAAAPRRPRRPARRAAASARPPAAPRARGAPPARRRRARSPARGPARRRRRPTPRARPGRSGSSTAAPRRACPRRARSAGCGSSPPRSAR